MSNEVLISFSQFVEKLKENKEHSFYVTLEKEDSETGIDEIIAEASIDKGYATIMSKRGMK